MLFLSLLADTRWDFLKVKITRSARENQTNLKIVPEMVRFWGTLFILGLPR